MIAVVESHVLALGAAMRRHEPLQVAVCAQALQAALVDAQTWARRTGSLQHGMPPALHQRLAIAAARATACREAIARTLAAQGRELQVLLPAAAAAMAAGSAAGTAVYNAQGQRQVAASALGALA